MGLANATVVCERSEDWAAAGGREAYDAVTARAVGSAGDAWPSSPRRCSGRAALLLAWKGAASEARRPSWLGPPSGSRWSRSRSGP